MRWATIGAAVAGTGVALGAFAAHGLKARLAPDLLAIFETGARYHLLHALALFVVALAAGRGIPPRTADRACALFLAGIVLFSGSLYALALTGVRALGAITPLGGLAFLAAWAVLAWGLRRAAPGGTAALALAALGASLVASPAAAETFEPRPGLRLVEVARGFASPVHVVAPPGDARLFVVEQGGRVRIVRGGKIDPEPFLDLSEQTRAGGERGLLSLAFHPRFAANGLVYVNYTDRNGDTRVERYRVPPNTPDRVDPGSAQLVLMVDQPYANHNGGHVFFGPDSMLYVGMGDGGSGGDPQDRAQDPQSLLGKLLRLDVDGERPYAIPPGNPFAGRPAAGRPEIWALGLRNPWRCAFDPPSGSLFIADVGQSEWEEVHVEPDGRAGVNYGWNILEGREPYRPKGRPLATLARPLVVYPHPEGCSITGGVVYRGAAVPALAGHYVFSDYCAGWLRSFRVVDGRAVDLTEWSGASPGATTSFGVDGSGELHLVTSEGRLYRIAAAEARTGTTR